MKILISGASRGIGFYLLNELLAEGHLVIGLYNTTSPPPELKEYFQRLDLKKQHGLSGFITNNFKTDDKIVLLNCAGGNYNAFAHKSDYSKWIDLVQLNLGGSFNLIQSVLPIMRAAEFGRIINFSSVVAQKGIIGTSAYAASKAALWGMSKSIAAENAAKGITVNNLNLGYFDIGMISEVPEKVLAGVVNSIPMQKLGDPVNILHAVKFLISADYITGSSIDINGGLV